VVVLLAFRYVALALDLALALRVVAFALALRVVAMGLGLEGCGLGLGVVALLTSLILTLK